MIRIDKHGTIKQIKGDIDYKLIRLKVNNEVISNLTGWQFFIKVYDKGTLIIEYNLTTEVIPNNTGIQIMNDGIIKLNLIIPNNVKKGNYLYDFIVITPDGTKKTLLNNKLFIVE